MAAVGLQVIPHLVWTWRWIIEQVKHNTSKTLLGLLAAALGL